MARIRVRCGVCNARLKVPEAVCGGVIRCHHCKAKILVPSRSVQGTKTIRLRTSEAGFDVKEQPWLRVQCDCGKVIKAPIEWAGKMGQCPRCGKSHKMPSADSAVSSTLMRINRVDAFADSDQDEFSLDDSTNAEPQSAATLIAAPIVAKRVPENDEDNQASSVIDELARKDDKQSDEHKTPSSLDALDKDRESAEKAATDSDTKKPRPSTRSNIRPVGKPNVVREESSVIRTPPKPKPKPKSATDLNPPSEITDFKSYIENSGISLPNIGGFDPDIIEEDDTKYLRVTCTHCGKRVKAPPELSGKTGICPACGGVIVMPIADAQKLGPVVQLDGISTDSSLLNALDEIAPAPEEEAVGLEATGASGSGLLDAAQAEQQLMTIEGMTATEWEAEKQRRAMSIMRYRRGYVMWIFSRFTDWFTALFEGARAVPHASPVLATCIMIGLLIAAGSVSWSRMPDSYEWAFRNAVVPEYYYNGATGALESINPVTATDRINSQYKSAEFDDNKLLFKAYVYSCSGCINELDITIGFIEKCTTEARAALVKRQNALSNPEFTGYAEADEIVKQGTYIAVPGKFDWFPFNSEPAQAIIQNPIKCPDNAEPTQCYASTLNLASISVTPEPAPVLSAPTEVIPTSPAPTADPTDQAPATPAEQPAAVDAPAAEETPKEQAPATPTAPAP